MIQRFEGSGSCISRVREQLLPGFFLFRVQAFKRVKGKKNLPPHFDEVRWCLIDQLTWNGLDGADIRRDIFADIPISPGDGTQQLAVFINQGNGHSVVFEFQGKFDRFTFQTFVHALCPIGDVLSIVAV